MKYKLTLAAAALMAGFLSFGGAQAATVMTGSGAPAAHITKMQDGNIQDVSNRKHRRHWRGKHRWRGGHRGHRWHGGNHWRRSSGVYLGLGFAPFFYGGPDYYDAPAYYAPARGSRHVRWCYNRYRSYDARSNSFLGYDGDRHRCRSPYRY